MEVTIQNREVKDDDHRHEDLLDNQSAASSVGTVKSERAFPFMSWHLAGYRLSQRLREAMQSYMRRQYLEWMNSDLAFLNTHRIRLAGCQVDKPVNANVLRHRSGFFKALFEYHESTLIDFKLGWLAPIAPSLLAVIDDIDISGISRAIITDENCLPMYLAADFLLWDQLRLRCGQFIQKRCEADPRIALIIWCFSHGLYLPELTQASLKFVLKGFVELRQTEEFLDLDADALREIIDHRMLGCTSELQVLETIGHWLRRGPLNSQNIRKRSLERLLCCARLGQLRQPAELKAAQSLPAVLESSVIDYLDYLRGFPKPSAFSIRHELELSQHASRPRRPHQVALLFCASSRARRELQQGEPLAVGFVYDHRADTWSRKPPDSRCVADLTDARLRYLAVRVDATLQSCRLCCISVGETIFCVGGLWCGLAHRLVLRYDRRRPELGWQESSQLSHPRFGHCCALVEGFLYAVGGLSVGVGGGAIASVERMAVGETANLWSAIDSMLRPRSGAAAVCHLGRLLVVGGHDGGSFLDSGEVFCPVSGAWSSLSGSMSRRRVGLGLISYGDSVYALGGRNAKDWHQTVERWEEGKGWRSHARIQTPKSDFGFAALDGRAYLFGGVNAKGACSTTEWVDLTRQDPLYGQGHPVPLTGDSFATCLLSVELEDAAP